MTNQETKYLNFLLSKVGIKEINNSQRDYIIDNFAEVEYYDNNLRGFETENEMFCIIDNDSLFVYSNESDFYEDWQLFVSQKEEELNKAFDKCKDNNY